MLTCALKAHEN